MSSQLQIEANRRNSQKSTGPRTAAGIAVSSQNALGSGVYAESETIRDENPSDLEALAASSPAKKRMRTVLRGAFRIVRALAAFDRAVEAC